MKTMLSRRDIRVLLPNVEFQEIEDRNFRMLSLR
jgi:hypothetical protein